METEGGLLSVIPGRVLLLDGLPAQRPLFAARVGGSEPRELTVQLALKGCTLALAWQ